MKTPRQALILANVLLSWLILGTNASAFAQTGPWPFPWAKTCELDWDMLPGRYVSFDRGVSEELELHVTVQRQFTWRLVEVSRYDRAGQLIARGHTWVPPHQNVISFWMYPERTQDAPVEVELKLYRREETTESCAVEQVFPALTLAHVDPAHPGTQYRLIKR